MDGDLNDQAQDFGYKICLRNIHTPLMQTLKELHAYKEAINLLIII